MRDILISSQSMFKNKILLVFNFALLNIKIRFKSTYLGLIWAALEPLLYFIILYLVFTNIRNVGPDFAIYLISGLMIFHIFVRGTSGGLVSLTGNSGILKCVKIKKEFFPLVSTVAIGLLGFVDIAVFFALMPIFNFVPSWTIVFLPIPLILLLILILGLSYFLSIIAVFARDIQNIWGIFSHALLFISPIFWQVDEVGGFLLQIHKINPLGQLIDITHILVIEKQVPPLNDWLYTSLIIFGIFFTGLFIFKKFKNRVTEEL